MASTPCVFRTVTLQPNEPFNLPPGAELISATDINALTSTCPLPTLESLECWIIPIAMTDNEDGGNHVWMYQAPTFGTGISVDGTFYPQIINQGMEGAPFLYAFSQWVVANPQLNGLLIDAVGAEQDDPREGGLGTFCFKAPASIAETVYIEWKTTANNPPGGVQFGGDVYARFYAIPYADFTGTPKCSCTLPNT